MQNMTRTATEVYSRAPRSDFSFHPSTATAKGWAFISLIKSCFNKIATVYFSIHITFVDAECHFRVRKIAPDNRRELIRKAKGMFKLKWPSSVQLL